MGKSRPCGKKMTGDTYPGFRGMIREFEDVLAWWWMDGSPKKDYKVKYYEGSFETSLDASSLPRISFRRTYDVNYSGFLFRNKNTVEEDQLQAYCVQNGLTYNINYWSKYVSVSLCAPSYEALKKCALMNKLREIYQWLGGYLEIAQKFAANPMMEEIKKYQQKKFLYNGQIRPWGISYPSTSDSEGYTSASGSFSFANCGYRNLQSEEEMIGFMLAYSAKVNWNIEPRYLNLYGIRWRYYYNEDMSQAITEMPSYCAYDPLAHQPAVEKPPLKDFF